MRYERACHERLIGVLTVNVRAARYLGCMSMMSVEHVRLAAQRLRGVVRHTPLLESAELSSKSGLIIRMKMESMQHTGSFKFRGASNALALLEKSAGLRGVATHSSGNHALALATAARARGFACTVIMPNDAPRSKRAAVTDAGAKIIMCEPTMHSREATLAEVVARSGAVVIPPFDHVDVICGQGTIGLEIVDEWPAVDVIVAPIGGGGMIGGIALAAKCCKPSIVVIAAEPAVADDAARSKCTGMRQPATNAPTLADGLRAGIGELTLPLLQKFVNDVVTVSEHDIAHWMQFAFEQMKLVIEPSAAVGVAALCSPTFQSMAKKSGWKNVALVICGGNVDLDRLPWLTR